MLKLFLMRHAKALPAMPGQSDFNRLLAPSGYRQAREAGEYFKRLGELPQRVLSSSALRAKETAKLWASTAGFKGSINFNRQLYEATVTLYFELLVGLGGSAPVLLIAHNPTIESAAFLLSGQQLSLNTGAFVLINIDIESWVELAVGVRGTLAMSFRV